MPPTHVRILRNVLERAERGWAPARTRAFGLLMSQMRLLRLMLSIRQSWNCMTENAAAIRPPSSHEMSATVRLISLGSLKTVSVFADGGSDEWSA